MTTSKATSKKKAVSKKKIAKQTIRNTKAKTVKKKVVKKKTAAKKKTIKAKPKKRKLTQKQEAACQAFIECNGNQSEAYRTAYNAENMSPESVWKEASNLFNLPHVTSRVIELQEMHVERHKITVDSITDDLIYNRKIAQELGQSAAMNGATLGIAKIHGLVVDKVQDVGRKKKREWNVIVVNSER